MFLDDLRARNSKLLRLRSIDSSLVNASMASRLSEDFETRSLDFEIGLSNLRTTGFDSSYSISLSKPSVDLENQHEATSRLSGDFDNRFDDLLRGNLDSNSSNISEPLGIRFEDFLTIDRTSGCSSFVSTLILEAVTASKLSGDKEAALLDGFLGNFDSNSSKMSEVRDNRLDDFLAIETFLGSVGEDAALFTLAG